MDTARDGRRVSPLRTRHPLTIEVDGEMVQAYAGESVATVLLALGRHTFRHTEQGAARGLYCGMGVCFDCLVTVDGVENVRACTTPVQAGMVIATSGGIEPAGGAAPGDRAHG